ncbi:MAG: pyridoxal phosphate-dependent aminotransferase [Clostridia bacterium]|nr:pyridoxal phosphate-dependent aminotransferase [Clostridia bacterium]
MINQKMRELGAKRSVIRELFEYGKKRKSEVGEDNVFDFSLGNPSVPAPKEVNLVLERLLRQEDSVKLHGYTSAEGDLSVRRAIAEYVNRTEGEEIRPECVYMTVGASAALTISLKALVSPGEEVITYSPYFPEYKVFVEAVGAKLVEVPGRDGDLLLDIENIRAHINEKTAAVMINSPNNPTGVIFDEENIKALADMLRQMSEKLGRTIYLISDEPYRELVYDDVKVPYVTRYYDDTLVCYSFSKSISLPGERIGYILISPRINDFASVRAAVAGAGRALGFVCAPSMLQRLVAECLGKTSDISVYDKNRRLLLSSLTEYGYEVIKPQGAFYLFIKSPSGDGVEFSERAKGMDILIVPSDDFGIPGYVRLSYCVKTETIERALPTFKKLIESYR